jgi:phage-related protein
MALQIKSDMTYSESRYNSNDKPLVWLHGKVRTPPSSAEARLEAGFLIRRLQKNERLSMPHSRPMPSIGRRCHELRINDGDLSWRIVYRIDQDAIVILEVFDKKTKRTPKSVIDTCKDRIRGYEDATK